MKLAILRSGIIAIGMQLFFTHGANAALISVSGGQAVLDSSTSLMWLANANLAATNTFGVSGIQANGMMNLSTAQNWVAAMNAAKYLGYSNWMLPVAGPINGSSYNLAYAYNGSTDNGYNISGPGTAYAGSQVNQMSYLFYNSLGNLGYRNVNGNLQSNTFNSGPFVNIQSFSNGIYWTGTADPTTLGNALDYSLYYGFQASNANTLNFFATAVRSTSPVNSNSVPEPSSLLLLGIGLMGMARKAGNLSKKFTHLLPMKTNNRK